MKLQFSLQTMLAATAALAVVCAFAAISPADQILKSGTVKFAEFYQGKAVYEILDHDLVIRRPPNGFEVCKRLALFGPLAIGGMLAAQWVFNRARSLAKRSLK
jgi:hypothetical protein